MTQMLEETSMFMQSKDSHGNSLDTAKAEIGSQQQEQASMDSKLMVTAGQSANEDVLMENTGPMTVDHPEAMDSSMVVAEPSAEMEMVTATTTTPSVDDAQSEAGENASVNHPDVTSNHDEQMEEEQEESSAPAVQSSSVVMQHPVPVDEDGNPLRTLLSPTHAFADISQRCFEKLGRWINKLSSPTAIRDYHLFDPVEIEGASRKFLIMIRGVQDAIEYEWIEEETIFSDEKLNPLHEFKVAYEETMTAAQSEQGDVATSTQRERRRSSVVPAETEKTFEEAILSLPSNQPGRQQKLHPDFEIGQLPPLPTRDDGSVLSTASRVCVYCDVPIYNRGWLCKEMLAVANEETSSERNHHVCCSCISEGLVCHARHTMIMVQRFSPRVLIERYQKAIKMYNTILLPQRRRHGNIQVAEPLLMDAETGELIDPYANSDPRPLQGRSEVTISYHLNLRLINSYPDYLCAGCKLKRPAWEIVACANAEHRFSLCKTNLSRYDKVGFYYCTRCVGLNTEKDGMEALGDRYWECPSCAALSAESTTHQTRSLTEPAPSISQNSSKSSTQAGSTSLSNNANNARRRGGRNRKRQYNEDSAEEDEEEESVPPARKSARATPVSGQQQQQQQPSARPSIHNPTKQEQSSSAAGTSSYASAAAQQMDENRVSHDSWLDMNVGRWITDLQQTSTRESERADRLQRELDEMRELAVSQTQHQDLMRENLQLKMDLSAARDEITRLSLRINELEKLNDVASSSVVPNLKKIAKAVATQASLLAKALPALPDRPRDAVGQ